MTEPRDPTLDVLLDLDGQALVVDPEGHQWVRFVVTRVPVLPEKPHGADGEVRIMGSKGDLLRTLAAAGVTSPTAEFAVLYRNGVP